MKGLFAITLALLLGATARGEEKAVPFESVSLTVDVNDSWHRIFSGGKDKFAVTMTVYTDKQQRWPNCRTSIFCRSLHEDTDLSMDDVKAMSEVAAAAAAKKSLKKEVSYESPRSSREAGSETKQLKTTFESVHKSGSKDVWMIAIKRTAAPVVFSLKEVTELQQMTKQANDAVLWFETLLTAPVIPKPTEIAKPPIGSICSFNGLVGNIERDKIRYQVDLLQYDEFSRAPDGINHSITIFARREGPEGMSSWKSDVMVMDDGSPVFHGEWVRGMMVHVTHAAAAAQKMESYSFVGREGALRYAVSADPNAKAAKLRIHPNFGNSDLTFYDVNYSLDDARAIADLINRAPEAKKWFKENQELFVAKSKP